MRVSSVRTALVMIQFSSDDPEMAHSMERNVWENVLRAIAHDPSNAQELATEALKTLDIDFERWMA